MEKEKYIIFMHIDPLKALGKIPKSLLIIFDVSLVLLIGVIDYVTGYQTSVSFLYLFPIMLIAWAGNRTSAILVSIIGAVTWLEADLARGHVYSHTAIPIWNFIMVSGIFLIIAFAILKIKKILQREYDHACNDYLTNVKNARYFYEQVRMEITRSARYNRPLTLAYIDIDDFKLMNDTYGHNIGDYLLRTVAESMKSTLRSIDVISRIGGDEFAILMPETNEEQAIIAATKVHEQSLQLVKKNGWPVTFSLGVITCYSPTCSADELIKMADALMYDAKKSGKNAIKFGFFEQRKTCYQSDRIIYQEAKMEIILR